MTYKSLLVVAWKCGSAVGGEEGKKGIGLYSEYSVEIYCHCGTYNGDGVPLTLKSPTRDELTVTIPPPLTKESKAHSGIHSILIHSQCCRRLSPQRWLEVLQRR